MLKLTLTEQDQTPNHVTQSIDEIACLGAKGLGPEMNPSLDQNTFENRRQRLSDNGHGRPWGYGCCFNKVVSGFSPIYLFCGVVGILEDNQIVSTRNTCGLRIAELMRFLSASFDFFDPSFWMRAKKIFFSFEVCFTKKGLKNSIEG